MPFRDLYHRLLTIGWPAFIGFLFGVFLGFNLLFMLLYRVGGDCIGAANPASWLQTFSFSVQTMAAIGYGTMSPTTDYAYVLSNAEGFLGLLTLAMASGLVFARFSRPTARVRFSDVAVVRPRNGVPTLQFRVANERGNVVVDARVQVAVLVREETAEGERLRRVYDLDLVRDQTPLFSLSWVVMHELTEESPLARVLAAEDEPVTLIVNLIGLDGSLVQTIHAQTSYGREQILAGHGFRDMVDIAEDGRVTVHHDRIHEVVPLG